MPDTISELLLLSSAIALGFLAAVAFYESLCKRDVLVGRVMRLARRVSKRPWVHALAYVVSVGIGIPVLVVTWAVVLETILLVIGSVDRLGNIALVATATVAAARILAYVREQTSHELAKAIPLSVAFLLLTGGALQLDTNIERVTADPSQIALTEEMITFLIALEIGLRLMKDASQAMLRAIRTRRGTESDMGVWRTLWAAVRRPVTPR